MLLTVRIISGLYNIVHDCDEVYNYWEPLHYLMYGKGMQTWEYSAQYALRSWWYLLLHAIVASPVALFLGNQRGKIVVFYFVKCALGSASAFSEWLLLRQVDQTYSRTVSTIFLTLLSVSSGLFVSSSSLLPSSFTMYAVTLAAAAVLDGNMHLAIDSSVIGVLWGWCVAAPAFMPFAIWVLASFNIVRSIKHLLLSLCAALLPLVVTDRIFYGNWKASLWNFLMYNVAGGGKSSLYGIEDWTYYFRNGLNQLQLILPLALVLPLVSLIAMTMGALPKCSKAQAARWIACLAPFYVWLGAITALPHKEERFLYVVYPLACLAAAVTLDMLAKLACRILGSYAGSKVGALGIVAALTAVTVLATSRSMALVTYYGAPMHVYKALPSNHSGLYMNGDVNVCIGAEWYRFPSSFFLPGPRYQLRFVKSGFNGLLPRPFDKSQGGARAASPYLNDENKEEPHNYWDTADECDYLVVLHSNTSSIDWVTNGGMSWHADGKTWKVLRQDRFVDATASPALARALYIPSWSSQRLTWLQYAILGRLQDKA